MRALGLAVAVGGWAVAVGGLLATDSLAARIVLVSDGNENIGDAMAAVLAARPLGVTIDVLPMGSSRGNDVFVQKVSMPSKRR